MPSKKYILRRLKELEDKVKILRADVEEHYYKENYEHSDICICGHHRNNHPIEWWNTEKRKWEKCNFFIADCRENKK